MKALKFDNTFTRELPSDPETTNFRRQVMGACYSRVKPVHVIAPKLVAYSSESASLIDLSIDRSEEDEFTQIFSGNKLLSGMDTYAACYGGHQFGNWAGQLGDGRVINLGEVINHQSERFTLQLKGAGPTPYSRNADGLAVLRSSIREFLCSEAMFHLGVPTTRALSLILTGNMVERDMFYDGHPKEEPGAVVCRIAPSFTRFGSFEIFAFRNDIGVLKKLLDYTIRTDFPHLLKPDMQNIYGDVNSSGISAFSDTGSSFNQERYSPYNEGSSTLNKSRYTENLSSKVYLDWFEEVCRRTADMVVHWMRVGFVHGVMNTDNMSVLGLTIDYGPYGWLENYDPDWTPNTTDAHGRRYCFGNQVAVAHWNLGQLANAIYPLIGEVEPLQRALSVYPARFKEQWNIMVAAKLGLQHFNPETDVSLSRELFDILSLVETDMTIFFRKLALIDFCGNGVGSIAGKSNVMHEKSEIISQRSLPKQLMDAYYVPEQLTGEYIARLTEWLKCYAKRLYQNNLGHEERMLKMNAVNPKYVLRNYLAQMAIDQAENGDFSMIHELMKLLRNPYNEQPEKEEFAKKRPEWARYKHGCSMLSCSS